MMLSARWRNVGSSDLMRKQSYPAADGSAFGQSVGQEQRRVVQQHERCQVQGQPRMFTVPRRHALELGYQIRGDGLLNVVQQCELQLRS